MDNTLETMNEGIDIVYALGSGSRWRNNEIIYSLRSIEKHVSGWRNVFIVGIKPSGLGHIIHVPADDLLDKNADGNIARKVLLACAHPNLSDTFLFINDDHLFVKDIDILDIPPFNKGDLKEKSEQSYENGGLYVKRLKRTKDILIKHNLPTLHYDCHTPILIDKHKFPGIIRRFNFEEGIGYGMKSLYGNSMGFDSPYLADLNIKQPLNYDQIMAIAEERTIMAYNDNGLNTDLKKFLNDKFPNKSKFEIMERQRQVALHEAQVWLADPKKSFKEGVRIYSWLGRDKRLLARFKAINNEMMMSKLLKELEKIKNSMIAAGIEPIIEKKKAPASGKVPAKTPKTPPAGKTEGTEEAGSKRLRVDINPSIDINLLPADKRELFEQNQKFTREITSLHEKMKLEKYEYNRKYLANEITAKEDIREENWKILDAWWKEYTTGIGKPKEITEPSGKYVKPVIEGIANPEVRALSKDLRIRANQNYIKRYKDSQKPDQVKEVALRIKEMNDWGVIIK